MITFRFYTMDRVVFAEGYVGVCFKVRFNHAVAHDHDGVA